MLRQHWWDSQRRILVIEGEGKVDLAEREALVAAFLADPALPESFGILVDASRIAPAPREAEAPRVAALVVRLAERCRGGVALLNSNFEHLVTTFVIERGTLASHAKVRGFYDRALAIAWLLRSEEASGN